MTFQQAPCAGAVQQTKLDVKANGGDAAAAPASGTVDQRMAALLASDRRKRELAFQIQQMEETISNRNGQMGAEIEQLRQRKSFARNNLAGATWEQSLSTEMQAVTQKYQAMNTLDMDRLKELRVTQAKSD